MKIERCKPVALASALLALSACGPGTQNTNGDGASDIVDAATDNAVSDTSTDTPNDTNDVLVADASDASPADTNNAETTVDVAADVVADVASDTGTSCGTNEVLCGTRCTQTMIDSFNCGMCGRACGAGRSCVGGMCECPMGATMCGANCTNLQNDPSNCGTCGNACPMGQNCAAGMCVCPAGTLLCGGACIETQSNESNCGMCARACGTGQVCAMGACTCPTGQTACGMGSSATCINTQTDNNNCGSCGNTCAAGQTCSMGMCVCPMGQLSCGTGSAARCIDPQTDNANCGTCGTTCNGGSACTAGACTCPMGETRCGMGMSAACVNMQTDNANCGMCGNACPTGQVCNGGTCQLTCTSPLMRCSSGSTMSCANLQTDDQNCGACGTTCAAAPNTVSSFCSAGMCSPICQSGFANCDGTFANGCETSLTTNNAHCGACGIACPSSAPNASAVRCSAGACRAECVAETPTLRPRDCNGFAADGCEANLLSDSNNCGACGTACPMGVPCVGGLCSARSCRELKMAAPTLPSGEYEIDPDGPGGQASMRVYCDMTTDGGGWTLIAYASVDNPGYSYCGGPMRLHNFYSLARGGGVYQGAMRTNAASLAAVPLARISTEILFGRSSTMGYSGDIGGMTAAAKFSIPTPSAVNFGNASPFAPSSNRGNCVPVTVTSVVGPAVVGMRYTFANALSVSWTDAYPTSYGVFSTSNCLNGSGAGPAFANEYSGSFNNNYAPNGYCGNATTNLEQPTYVHHGWWDANNWMQTGTASIWLR